VQRTPQQEALYAAQAGQEEPHIMPQANPEITDECAMMPVQLKVWTSMQDARRTLAEHLLTVIEFGNHPDDFNAHVEVVVGDMQVDLLVAVDGHIDLHATREMRDWMDFDGIREPGETLLRWGHRAAPAPVEGGA